MADEDSDQVADKPSETEQRLLSKIFGDAQDAVNVLPDAARALLISYLQSAFEPVRPEDFVVREGPDTVEIFNTTIAWQYIIAMKPDAVKTEDLSRLAARAARVGINKLSPAQIFVLVLLWLLLVGIPLIQQKMPSEAQGMINSEAGTIGVGLGITALILQKRK